MVLASLSWLSSLTSQKWPKTPLKPATNKTKTKRVWLELGDQDQQTHLMKKQKNSVDTKKGRQILYYRYI